MKVFLAKFSQNWDENEIIEFVQRQEDQKCHLFNLRKPIARAISNLGQKHLKSWLEAPGPTLCVCAYYTSLTA